MTELIDRAELLKLVFPLGYPACDWDYCVSARAIFDAIMRCRVVEGDIAPETPIDDVDLPHVAIRAFRMAGIHTVEELLGMTRNRLLGLPHIGPKKADIIVEALERQGYDCTKLKTMEDARLARLREIKERGYAPKVK